MWKWTPSKEAHCNGMLPRCLPGTQVKGPGCSDRDDGAKFSVYLILKQKKRLIPTSANSHRKDKHPGFFP